MRLTAGDNITQAIRARCDADCIEHSEKYFFEKIKKKPN